MKTYNVEAHTETRTVMTESSGGNWVKREDYERLANERDSLRAQLEECRQSLDELGY